MPRKKLDDFLAQLAAGKTVPAVLLYGADAYLRDLTREKLVETFVPEGAREWATARFSAADAGLATILNHARTLPMLAQRQVLFVEEVDALEGGKEEAREEAVRLLAEYLGDPAPFTLLVLEAAQLDQRMKLSKLLGEKTLVVAMELGEEGPERAAMAAAMASRMAKDLGATLDREAAAELVDILDGSLSRIRMELMKLATYTGRGGRITVTMVEALVAPARKYSVWQLAEMLAGRSGDRALVFLDSVLREGEEPVGIVGALAWMFRKLLEAQELPRGTNSGQAARMLVMRPETAELALAQSRKYPRQKLLEGLAALADADNRLKSGTRDPRAVLEFLVARLTSATP